jgi:hypothetical protein
LWRVHARRKYGTYVPRTRLDDGITAQTRLSCQINPIERCWSALEKRWNGVLLNCLKVVLQCALRMKWKGRYPTVKRLDGEYPDGVRVAAKEMKEYEARLERSATLPKYDITIKPKITDRQVS